VFEPTSTYEEADNSVAYDAGKATGDDHDLGTTTVDGTVMTYDTGNETIVDVIIVTITADGTESGTDDH